MVVALFIKPSLIYSFNSNLFINVINFAEQFSFQTVNNDIYKNHQDILKSDFNVNTIFSDNYT